VKHFNYTLEQLAYKDYFSIHIESKGFLDVQKFLKFIPSLVGEEEVAVFLEA
jgi:hypothetical protein